MKKIIYILILVSFISCRGENKNKSEEEIFFVFSYFIGEPRSRENEGLRLAISSNGLEWSVINNDQPVFTPEFGKVFRDPCIVQGKDGTFHVVWTTSWSTEGSKGMVGIAHSKDLINWYGAREIEVMENDSVLNCWAPELFWDDETNQWLLYWASSVKGKFSESLKKDKPAYANNRIYCRWLSPDFHVVGKSKLLYGPDFITNDVTIFKANDANGKYCMIVKRIVDPGKLAPLYLAFSNNVDGGYTLQEGNPISGNYQFCEGPTIATVNDSIYCIFDLSREKHMACIRTGELKSDAWENLTDRLQFPNGVKHGSILKIGKREFKELKNR